MGLLATGTPLAWPQAKKKADHVRDWGIQQLLAIWGRAKDKERDAMLWGDEVEYLVVCLDESHKKARLSLRQADILQELASNKDLIKKGGGVPDIATGHDHDGEVAPTFHPEFGRFMLEATPGKPWGIDLRDLLDVEPNMKWRRSLAKEHMAGTEFPVTLTTFPRLGLPDTTIPNFPPSGEKLRSQFVPDEIANPHIRFPTLAANIRARRGRKVEINVPVYKDENTPWPFADPTVNYDLHNWPEDDDVRNGAAKQNHIYMDAMAFGMGSCCLQITFQAKSIEEGRKMYDQLSPLGPIMLALTAATPIYKGFLADTDVRWNQIGRAVDDRTPEELGEKPLSSNRWRIPKSRYASNSTYIANDPRLRPEYWDPGLVVDPEIQERLMKGGMDKRLATHFAHLFIRDPIVIFNEDLEELDLNKADHFENLQSTNWQHMRFKPPPPGQDDTGWRVEFRSMEIQMSDFENAAFTVFIVLITRAILSFNLNFYIPITKVTENMETAHKRDAINTQKFFFRKDPMGAPTPNSSRPSSRLGTPNGTRENNASTGDVVEYRDGPDSRPIGREDAGRFRQIPHNGQETLHNERENLRNRQERSHYQPQEYTPVEEEYTLMSIDEVINGQSAATTDPFPGLIPLVESYLNSVNVDVETRCELNLYLDLIRKRANGSLLSGAQWIRKFVGSHAAYHHDSQVTDEIAFDLCKAAVDIADEKWRTPLHKDPTSGDAIGREMFFRSR